MAKVVAWFGHKSWRVDAEASEKALFNQPFPILQTGEKIELAFKGRGGWGWDRIYFTNKRVMTRNCNGTTGKKKAFLSIPYSTIKGYVVDTPSLIDTDVIVKIFSSGLEETTFEFAPGGCDTLEVMRHLNKYVLPGGMDQSNEAARTEAVQVEASKGGLMDLLGGDARQIPPEEIEPGLKMDPKNILLPNEKVELAFKCGRDTTIFTTHRYLIMDVQGITGRKVLYTSILWSSMRAFEVKTAGTLLDRDVEMAVYTSIKELKQLKTELNKDKCDLMAIQRYIGDKVLGIDEDPPSDVMDESEGERDGGGSLFGWIGNDARQIDSSLVNQKFHQGKSNVLQGSEKVELAFKGRRDLILFTNKRLMIVDYSGIISKKTKYLSFPWKTIKMFAVRSAGSFADKDSELMLWLDIMHDWVEYYEDRNGEQEFIRMDPIAGMSYLEMDFQKDKVDLMGVHRYLSQRVLAKSDVDANAEVQVDVSVGDQSMIGDFLGFLGGDNNQINHEVMTRKLHNQQMIMEDETVLMAMKCGKDTTCFTNKRIFFMDHQRTLGSEKMEYKTLPYGSLMAFEIETAGTFDGDAEAKYYIKSYWQNTIEQDMRKGKVDIFALQAILSSAVLGGQETSAGLERPVIDTPDQGALSGFMNMLNGDGAAFDAAEAEKLFRDGTPQILMADETVDMAFKCGRDFVLYTNLRLLTIDKQGLLGKKIAYHSTPFKALTSFEIQTAGGCCDNDSEAFFYTDIPGSSKVTTTMKADATGGIYDLMQLFSGKKLRDANAEEMADWETRTGKWNSENAAIAQAKADKEAAKAAAKAAKAAAKAAKGGGKDASALAASESAAPAAE